MRHNSENSLLELTIKNCSCSIYRANSPRQRRGNYKNYVSGIKIYLADLHDIILGKIARLEPRDFNDVMSLKAKGLINAHFLLKRLNENKVESKKNRGYRQNAVLLFKVVGSPIEFSEGKARLVK